MGIEKGAKLDNVTLSGRVHFRGHWFFSRSLLMIFEVIFFIFEVIFRQICETKLIIYSIYFHISIWRQNYNSIKIDKIARRRRFFCWKFEFWNAILNHLAYLMIFEVTQSFSRSLCQFSRFWLFLFVHFRGFFGNSWFSRFFKVFRGFEVENEPCLSGSS